MKVAIMVCGHMRTYKECYDNFIKTLILPNAQHEIDVFIATSSINSGRVNLKPTIPPMGEITFDKKYYQGHGLIYEIEKEKIKSEIKKTYKNKNFTLKEVFFQDEQIGDNNIDPMSWEWFRRGIFSKPWFCLNSIKNIENYDIIVRTRPDLILAKEIKLFDSDELKLFGGWPGDALKYESGKYTADFFAFGNYKNMKTYCDIHLMRKPIETTSKKHPYNSENQLMLYIKKNNLNLKYVLKNRREYEVKR